MCWKNVNMCSKFVSGKKKTAVYVKGRHEVFICFYVINLLSKKINSIVEGKVVIVMLMYVHSIKHFWAEIVIIFK